MKIALVVPAYKEAKKIEQVLSELKQYRLPVIVVDDGSKDQTFEIARKSGVKTLRHRVNLGKGAALKTGCELAFSEGAEAVIMMDSDGQHRAADLPKFIEALKSGQYDVVFGTRNYNLGVPFVRFIGNKVASVLISVLFGIYVSDLLCGYRGFTKKAYEDFKWQSRGYGVETEMVIRTGVCKLRRCEVPVETIYYEKFKGVTVLDAAGIFFEVINWRVKTWF